MVATIAISLALFALTYAISLTTVTVFYHRALCHRALALSPAAERFIWRWGIWITGLDPAVWICTHRLHHDFADTALDPHSPVHHPGLWRFSAAHLRMYTDTHARLRRRDPALVALSADLPGGPHFLMRGPVLPFYPLSWGNLLVYLVHLAVYVAIAHFSGHWSYAVAVGAGLLCHPFQGMTVNYFGHRHGYRNFETPDASTNHSLVAYLLMGEGYQNNHHRAPRSPNFAAKSGEFDLGYWVCRGLRKTGIVSF